MYYTSQVQKESKDVVFKRKIKSCEDELIRLETENKAAWDEIKDFTVSANKADANYKRMQKMQTDMKKIKTEIKRLKKKLDE